MQSFVYYPPTTKERYSPGVEETAKKFAELLFSPGRLGEVTHPDFREYLEGEGLTLNGLAALQEYRYRFGWPVLHRVNFFAVPLSGAGLRLSGGGKWTFAALMELSFTIPFDSLMREWRSGLNKDDEVPVQLRMIEPTFSRVLTADDEPVEGVAVGTRLVHERSYWPFLVDRVGQPHDQIAHVGKQAAYFARHRRPMSESPSWVPSWVAYNLTQEDKFAYDPTAGS